jgi:hypothetical protein
VVTAWGPAECMCIVCAGTTQVWPPGAALGEKAIADLAQGSPRMGTAWGPLGACALLKLSGWQTLVHCMLRKGRHHKPGSE